MQILNRTKRLELDLAQTTHEREPFKNRLPGLSVLEPLDARS